MRGFHYVPAAIGSFLVAVTNNYLWNRVWTFRAPARPRRAAGRPLLRRVDARARANLVVLHLLVSAGLGEVVSQAIAIVLVTPVNFVGNKLWSFRHRRR